MVINSRDLACASSAKGAERFVLDRTMCSDKLRKPGDFVSGILCARPAIEKRRPSRRCRHEQSAPPKFGMGAPVRRKEDKALVTGAGRFTDDYRAGGRLHAYVLRSAMAHARLKLGGLDEARAMPGVRLILTARRSRRRSAGCRARARSARSTARSRSRRTARCSSMPPAMSATRSPSSSPTPRSGEARAAEAIEVDYEPLAWSST